MRPALASAFSLALALALLALAVPARAQDAKPDAQPEVLVGSGLVCDTLEQTQRYIELYRGDPKEAAEAVNAEQGKPEACTFGTVAFIRGASVAKVRDKEDKPLQIAEILVLGIETPAGLMRIEPVRWFNHLPGGRDAGVRRRGTRRRTFLVIPGRRA